MPEDQGRWSFTDFLGLPNMVKLPLYANFLSYAQSSDSGPKKPVDRRDVLIVDGAVRQAYLLVHVARPLQTWEKVYVTVDERGGHLHGAEGLRAPVDPRSTTQLYDFHMVPHDVYGVAEPPSDWFSRLKPGARPIVHSFLSSTQPGLLDLSVFYECVEPGKCSIVHEGIR
jgi:hypothetical protein